MDSAANLSGYKEIVEQEFVVVNTSIKFYHIFKYDVDDKSIFCYHFPMKSKRKYTFTPEGLKKKREKSRLWYHALSDEKKVERLVAQLAGQERRRKRVQQLLEEAGDIL